jgi:GT2 family glycosyltransferase
MLPLDSMARRTRSSGRGKRRIQRQQATRARLGDFGIGMREPDEIVNGRSVDERCGQSIERESADRLHERVRPGAVTYGALSLVTCGRVGRMAPVRPLSFSVIIPTYARPARLAACLEALAGLDYPRAHYEVIVVDDGSPLPPRSVVRDCAERAGPSFQLTLVERPHAGPATARNAGAAQARGDFLAFTDDDCQPAANWLTELSARLLDHPDHIVGGRTINALSGNLFATASQLLVDYLYEQHRTASADTGFFTSNNLALARDGFQSLGGFDETFPLAAGEDRELCDRWLRGGGRLAFSPGAIVHHMHALTLRGFWRQQRNYGRGAYHFHRLRARGRQGTVRLESRSFYLDLLSYPIGRCPALRALPLMALMTLSQVAIATGFFSQLLKDRAFSPISPERRDADG